jgi:uncharacterized protein
MSKLSLLIKPASSACNMRCKYCFYHDVAENRSIGSFGIMEEETLETLIKRAFEYAQDECTFAFQGGEPTLAGLNYFLRFSQLVKQYNVNKIPVHNTIQTNGYLIDDAWAQYFKENNFLVGLSLDGDKAAHDKLRHDAKGDGTFERVMHGLKMLNNHKVDYNILCVVTNFSARHGDRIYSFFQKSGFRYLQFIQCLDPFSGETAPYSLTAKRYGQFLNTIFDRYYQDFKQGNYVSIRMFDDYVHMLLGKPPGSCGMSGVCTCYFVVESGGNVYPCDFYVLDEFQIGDIHHNSFHDMQNSENARRFVSGSMPVASECQKCKWFQLCRGGCRRCREPFVNGEPGLNQFCESYKMFFEHSYEKLCEIAQLVRFQ